ncbi:unnamed protein product, partial [Didymodactylos carnosus]
MLRLHLPKKGDLRDPNNWRDITLLSIPGKVLCAILADRIRPAIEKVLREEQAGFRPNRGCSDQIFTLRRIIEKSINKRYGIILNFIDFEKAFDSVHQESLWEILKSYGIPTKIVEIIKSLYEDAESCVKVNEEENTAWFKIKTGVRQECILSPLLFIIAIDWVLQKALKDQKLGIKLNYKQEIEDLDFADDIVLIADNTQKMQEKTDRIDTH